MNGQEQLIEDQVVWDYIHTPKRRVDEESELTDEERQWVSRITRYYQRLAHRFVIEDAKSNDAGTWASLQPMLREINQCEQCRLGLIAGFTRILALDTYKLSPDLKREDFVKRYQEIHGISLFESTS